MPAESLQWLLELLYQILTDVSQDLAVISQLYLTSYKILFPKYPLTINHFAFGKMRPGAGLLRISLDGCFLVPVLLVMSYPVRL